MAKTRIKTFLKDPDATLDYDLDFTGWLSIISDTIASVVWEVPTGVTKVGEGPDTPTVVKVWISGGTAGQTYRITGRITTAGIGGLQRIEDQSFDIRIKEQ